MKNRKLLLLIIFIVISMVTRESAFPENIKKRLARLGETMGYSGTYKNFRTKSPILRKELCPKFPEKAKVYEILPFKDKYTGKNLVKIAKEQFKFNENIKLFSSNVFVRDDIYGLRLSNNGNLSLSYQLEGEIDRKKLTPFNMTNGECRIVAEKYLDKYNIDYKDYIYHGCRIDEAANSEHTLGYSVTAFYTKPVDPEVKTQGFGNRIRVTIGPNNQLWELEYIVKKYELIGEYFLMPPEKAYEEIKKNNCFTLKQSDRFMGDTLCVGEIKTIKLFYLFETGYSQKYLEPYYFFCFKPLDGEKYGDIAIYPAINRELFDK